MQHILGQVRRCVEDYHMIEAGDKVAVGVSGGKDSLLTLTALARLRDFYPIPFQVEAITLETGTPGMSFDAVAELCRELDGKVWALTLAEPDVPASLVHHTISNLAREENGIRLRILSETQPHPDARPVEADLEEVFLYHCGEETQ